MCFAIFALSLCAEPSLSTFATAAALACRRGEIARWIARFLPHVKVVVWEARRWRFGRDDGGESIRCRVCRNQELSDKGSKTYDCPRLQDGLGAGDLVIVVGTGHVSCAYKTHLRDLPYCKQPLGTKEAFPSLLAIDQLWKQAEVVSVHFPVRSLLYLSEKHNIFKFDTIIPDDSFFKPMGGKDLGEDFDGCHLRQKSTDLLYVARYRAYKGQLKFLQQADPTLLGGHTINFYGGGAHEPGGPEYVAQLQAVAEERGISIIVHNHVPKTVLLQHICTAAGQNLWPEVDANPRAGEHPHPITSHSFPPPHPS